MIKKYVTKKNLVDGIWTITDQGLFAGSNFALNIWLANILSENLYGEFAYSYSLLLLISGIQNPIIIEPFLVYASGRYRKSFITYLRKINLLSILLTTSISLLTIFFLTVAQFIIKAPYYSHSILFSVCFAPLILHQWMLRKAAYAIKKPILAGVGNLFYVFLLFIPLLMLSTLTVEKVFLIMGIASLFSSFIVYFSILKTSSGKNKSINTWLIIVRHWKYGKWSLPASIFYWLIFNIPYILLANFFNTSYVGNFKALINITAPGTSFIKAFGNLLIPKLANKKNIVDKYKFVISVFSIFGIIYWSILYQFDEEIFQLLYGENYISEKLLVLLIGSLPLLVGIFSLNSSLLRALEKPKEVMISYLWGAISIVLVGSLMIFNLNIIGATLGTLLSILLVVIVSQYYTLKSRLNEL